MKNKKEEYVKENIPFDVERNTILNIVTRDVNPFTHGFHKYPAKFIPQIPRWAIRKYLDGKENCYILDPFCGSGTTLIEGILTSNNVIGIDIDPLSALISKVKTTPIDTDLLEKISIWIIQRLDITVGTFIPDCETINHWFTDDAVNKLSTLRTLIELIPIEFGSENKIIDIYNLFIICYSSIIRRVSNADNESQKTYVSHTKIKEPEEVFSTFISQLSYFKERITSFSKIKGENTQSKIFINSSATDIRKIFNEEMQIDLVVTSPPYIKSVDYIYNQMVELFWVGDLFQMQTQTKQNIKKTLYVGNNRIKKSEYIDYSPQKSKLGIKELDNNLQHIFNVDKKNGDKHAYITYQYFIDMENHFKNISQILAPHIHYVMVVGNSKVSDITFDTAEYLVAIAERNGFKLTNKWGYKIKNRYMRFNRKGRGGIIDIDWVLDFEKQ